MKRITFKNIEIETIKRYAEQTWENISNLSDTEIKDWIEEKINHTRTIEHGLFYSFGIVDDLLAINYYKFGPDNSFSKELRETLKVIDPVGILPVTEY